MRKRLVMTFAVLAAIAGLAVGGTALAGGFGSGSSPAGSEAAQPATHSIEAENGNDAATEPAGEQGDKEDDDQTQEPSYTGSITAPEVDGASEADEVKALEALATISSDQATQAALAAVPGTVDEVELENENGSVVYDVEVKTADGKLVDVTVDAGDGTVLAQEADEDEAGEGSEQHEGAEQPESAEPGSATNG